MSRVSIPGDLSVGRHLTCKTITLPSNSVGNAQVVPGAEIAATKLQHQHVISYWQPAGSDIASATVPVHVAREDGEVIAIQIVATTAPTGGDKKFTVDLQKGNDADAFASILTGAAEYDSDQDDKEVVSGSLVASPAYSAGDTLQLVVTASGASGSQGQGLIVTITVRQDAEP